MLQEIKTVPEDQGIIASNLPLENVDIPLISIILVSLNSRNTIEQTILSIIHNDYPNKEFILIDGESVDGTTEIIEKYKKHIDILLVEKDDGIYDAMNKGAKLAKGDYFYFTGADDIIINSWHYLIGRFRSADTVYYGNVYFPISNQVYDYKFGKLKRMIRNICHQAIFYPRSVFDKYKYSHRYLLNSDFHLNIVLNSDPEYNFKYIDLIVAVFSEKGISTTRNDIFFKADHLKIIREHYSIFLYLLSYILLSVSKWISRIKSRS